MIFCSFQDLEEGKQATRNSGGIRIQVFTFYLFMKLSAFHNSIPCWVAQSTELNICYCQMLHT